MADTCLAEEIRTIARGLGIIDIGFASVDLWNTDPIVSSRISEASRPASIMIGARTAIVIGIPVPNSTLQTAPSIAYAHMYANINSMLDQSAQRIAMELMARGYDAMPLPRDGYHGIGGLRESASAFFSHRHAAYLCGLGTFGVNNVIITPGNGPRIRWTTIITTAELPSGKPMEEEVCIHCDRCIKACPVDALSPGRYPEVITVKESCIDRAEILAKQKISPCGICLAACPVGLKKDSAVPSEEAKAVIRSYVRN